MSKANGTIIGVNGNLIAVAFEEGVQQNEMAFAILGDRRLKAEVVRIRGDVAELQVFESTRGLGVGDRVEFSGELLTVTLGPGLLGQIFDGLQNPLPALAEAHGVFLPKGLYADALDPARRWEFEPRARRGETLRAGATFGAVAEGMFEHRIMVPFDFRGEGTLTGLAQAGAYSVSEPVATVRDGNGAERSLSLSFRWPAKLPIRCFSERLLPEEPMITGTRVIDSFFPVGRGGAFCIPGPFGAGKTVLQQVTSRYAQVDVVIVAACGERAGEVVETMREFPGLTDPRTGRSLMERTIIICNTSSMPVAAREASIYTAATLAEYYRQMGLHVLLLADSTSRWAQALREMSGRLEEIPGEEAFPAYLESRIGAFYERAGIVRLHDGSIGSVTIGGTVSPAGGNFEEPVTQSTLKVVGAFLGLSRNRAEARRYPAIDPLESWSKYSGPLSPSSVARAQQVLRRGENTRQMMTVIGEEAISVDDYAGYLKSEFLDASYLQQNSFDDVDAFSSSERQQHVFEVILWILDANLDFSSKDDTRAFFNNLRQKFIDWNHTPWGSEQFSRLEADIRALVEARRSAALEG